MSHLVVKKKGSGYQAWDKNRKKFVGKVMSSKTHASRVTRSRDMKEDKEEG